MADIGTSPQGGLLLDDVKAAVLLRMIPGRTYKFDSRILKDQDIVDERKYKVFKLKFVKAYSNFLLFERKSGCMECFSYMDILRILSGGGY